MCIISITQKIDDKIKVLTKKIKTNREYTDKYEQDVRQIAHTRHFDAFEYRAKKREILKDKARIEELNWVIENL